MAPKKKPAAAGDGPDLFEEFVKLYKKKEKELETAPLPAVKEIIRKMEEEDVKSWCFYDEFDPMSFRILFQCLRQSQFPDIEAIRVWKCNGGDESVRSICHYLDEEPNPNVKDVHFTDNGVTPLGCEFLGRTLGPTGNKMINLLKLDYNQFGTAGVEKLSVGLSQNATLRHLSLQYCGIAEDGGQYIAHMLMFFKCTMEVLELRGNYLQDKGVVDVLNGARRSKTLARIDLYDNKFSDSPEVIKALRELFANNVALTQYNLSGNRISDAGASMLVNGMIGHNHLDKVFVTEQVSSKTWEALEEVTSGKGKKKGKKK